MSETGKQGADMAEIKVYTDAQATDEALLIFMRRMHRLYPNEYTAVLTSLSDGQRTTLNAAEVRADKLRTETAAGAKYVYPCDLESAEDGD